MLSCIDVKLVYDVAEMVLDAVRNERYFVPTMPSHASQLRDRLDALLAGNLPPIPSFD